MRKFEELDERLNRSKQLASAAIQQEYAAREAKTAKLRAMRMAEEAKGRQPLTEARRRKPSSG
jgi:hypothetical protein